MNLCKTATLKRPKLVSDNYHLMQVESIAECSKGEHSAILSTFIMLPFVIKIFVFSFLSGRFTQILLYLFEIAEGLFYWNSVLIEFVLQGCCSLIL